MPASAAEYACLRSWESRVSGRSPLAAANAAATNSELAAITPMTMIMEKPCSAQM